MVYDPLLAPPDPVDPGLLALEDSVEEIQAAIVAITADIATLAPANIEAIQTEIDDLLTLLESLEGIPGDTGPTGAIGPAGIQGAPGEQGIPGDTGSQGMQGDQGDTGLTGDEGPPGEAGIQGEEGEQGIQGIQGDPGATGATGPEGDPGTQGDPGDPGDLTALEEFNVKLLKMGNGSTWTNISDDQYFEENYGVASLMWLTVEAKHFIENDTQTNVNNLVTQMATVLAFMGTWQGTVTYEDKLIEIWDMFTSLQNYYGPENVARMDEIAALDARITTLEGA